ncbi:MAG: MurR/RpiR family transcriptional regulator [Candidatus Dormiibacterota bacterium]
MPEFLVGELVRQRMETLSASERRLAQVLLAFYPVAGLESLTRFAERAGVSPATVTRFITKLGLRGYPEFQDSLREELQARLSSPLARFELATPGEPSDSVLHDSFATFEHSLRASLDMVSQHDFDAVVDLLSDPRRRILALGGRVSAFLARYLANQLHLIRGGVELIDPERSNPADHLVDVGRRDVLVVYDYRRYQSDSINSARVAAARRSTVVLVTDPWLSPAAASAKFVLVTDVQTTVAPFDSMVSGAALTEALIAGVLARLGESAHARMRKLDELRGGIVYGDGR